MCVNVCHYVSNISFKKMLSLRDMYKKLKFQTESFQLFSLLR
jgi:hypothetical protein